MLLCGAKVMEISSMTIIVCFPQTAPPIFSSALVRGIIQGESAVEKKKRYALHINTPLKC